MTIHLHLTVNCIKTITPPKFLTIYANAISKIIDKYDLENNVCIESQNTDFLLKLKAKNKNYRLFIYPSSFEDGLQQALKLELNGLSVSTEAITKEQIEIAHQHNLYVAIWNIHSKDKSKEAIKKNPDFIQTDKVEYLVDLLE